jgi:CRP-like cAMP-binding protein
MKTLRKYIDSISPLAETEWTAIVDIAMTVHLKKGELLVQEGDRYNKEVFIESGIVRGFIIDEEGNEKSTAFFQEGEFMSTNTFRTQNGFSTYSYQALCEITLLLFDAD